MNNADSQRRRAGPDWSGLRRVLGIVLIVYVAVLLLLKIFENSLIFPAPRYPSGNWEPAELYYEDVYFESADGTRLHGWYLEHPQPQAHVLFCHGNGEHIAYRAEFLRRLRQRYAVTIFAFDYRGYGRSEGRPDEHGVMADGCTAHQWLATRAGIATDQVVLYGSSLGGAVVIDSATRQGARGLILESTFTSMPDVAAPLLWWAPVRWFMHSQMNSEEKIRQYHGPILQSHGTADSLVPFELGQRLHAAAPTENKRFISMPGHDHNDPASPAFWDALAEFLTSLP